MPLCIMMLSMFMFQVVSHICKSILSSRTVPILVEALHSGANRKLIYVCMCKLTSSRKEQNFQMCETTQEIIQI
jgi:hypothetical protein